MTTESPTPSKFWHIHQCTLAELETELNKVHAIPSAVVIDVTGLDPDHCWIAYVDMPKPEPEEGKTFKQLLEEGSFDDELGKLKELDKV